MSLLLGASVLEQLTSAKQAHPTTAGPLFLKRTHLFCSKFKNSAGGTFARCFLWRYTGLCPLGMCFFKDSGLSRTIEETLVSNDSGESIERNLKIHSMQVYDERAANYESWVRAYLAKTAALGEPSPVSAFPCFPTFS